MKTEKIAGIITTVIYVGWTLFISYVFPYHDFTGKVILILLTILAISISNILREGIQEDLEEIKAWF